MHGWSRAASASHPRLIERRPLRREQHAMRARPLRRIGVERLDARDEDVDPHHHPAAAAVRRVVDALVLAEPEVARRPRSNRDLAARNGARHDARRREPRENLGEQRDDVEPHRSSPSIVSSVTTPRRALSTSFGHERGDEDEWDFPILSSVERRVHDQRLDARVAAKLAHRAERQQRVARARTLRAPSTSQT